MEGLTKALLFMTIATAAAALLNALCMALFKKYPKIPYIILNLDKLLIKKGSFNNDRN